MIVLGIAGGYDANWCLVRDGVLLRAFEKGAPSVSGTRGEAVFLIALCYGRADARSG
jgi:hypothetical protein